STPHRPAVPCEIWYCCETIGQSWRSPSPSALGSSWPPRRPSGPVSRLYREGSSAFTDVNTLLEQHARRRPDKIFIESPDQGTRITFGELEALTRRFANFLASEGVRAGDRISLL